MYHEQHIKIMYLEHVDFALGIQCWFNITEINKCHTVVDTNTEIISLEVKVGIDRIQYPFMMKTLKKLLTEVWHNIGKAI